MQHSEVSILIPTCNRSGFLRESIDSVLAEMGPDDELLVIDDGSTDDTVEILKSYGAALRFVSTPNRGKSAALNLGLRETKNPLIWIVDDDDIILPGAKNTLISLIESEDADFAYGRYDRFKDDANGSRKRLGTGYWATCEPRDVLARTLEDMFVHQPGMIAKRSLYDKAGPFDEGLYRSIDYDMEIRLLLNGRAAMTDEVLFLQRVHNGLRKKGASVIQDRDKVWVESDQAIFNRMRDQIPLEAYVGNREILNVDDERAALLQRAAVYARKKLWASAVGDFERAQALSSTPLSPRERSIIRNAVFSKFGCVELIEDRSIAAMLADKLSGSEVGTQILANLSRALWYHAKKTLRAGKVLTAAKYGQLVLKLARKSRTATRQLFLFEIVNFAPSLFIRLRKLAFLVRRFPQADTRSVVTRQYFEWQNRKPDLRNPRGFSEKINALKLKGATALQTQCADKIRVREYVSNTVGDQYLTDALLSTYRLSDVNPQTIKHEQFVLKSSHDSGGVLICTDREAFDWQAARLFLAQRLSINHWHRHREPAYRNIKPGILVEEYLGDPNSTLQEFKLFCFRGEIAFIMAIDVENGVRTKTLYDLEWRRLPFKRANFIEAEKDIEKPAVLAEMLDISKRLSQPFQFCRVDLYVDNAALKFGELTFTPDAGLSVFEPLEWEHRVGDLLNLSNQYPQTSLKRLKIEH